MDTFKIEEANVGSSLPVVSFPAPTLQDCDSFMNAGDEFHAMHNDLEYARAAGHEDIVVPGLLLMAHLGRYMTKWLPRDRVRELAGRFESVCYPSDMLSIEGTLTDRFDVDGETRARVELRIIDANDVVRVRGDAIVALG